RRGGGVVGGGRGASGLWMGWERRISILSERGGLPAREHTDASPRRVALLVDEGKDLAAAVRAAKSLRSAGYLVSLELRRKNVKKQLEDLMTHGFWGLAGVEDQVRTHEIKPLVSKAAGR